MDLVAWTSSNGDKRDFFTNLFIETSLIFSGVFVNFLKKMYNRNDSPGDRGYAAAPNAHRLRGRPSRLRRSGRARRSPSAATPRPVPRSTNSTHLEMRAKQSSLAAPHRRRSTSTAVVGPTSRSSPSRKSRGLIRMLEVSQIALSKNFRRAALATSLTARLPDAIAEPFFSRSRVVSRATVPAQRGTAA